MQIYKRMNHDKWHTHNAFLQHIAGITSLGIGFYQIICISLLRKQFLGKHKNIALQNEEVANIVC